MQQQQQQHQRQQHSSIRALGFGVVTQQQQQQQYEERHNHGNSSSSSIGNNNHNKKSNNSNRPAERNNNNNNTTAIRRIMDVRSKIASFEAHNEGIRLSSPPSSPRIMMSSTTTTTPKNQQQQQQHFTTTSTNSFPRPTSTTKRGRTPPPPNNRGGGSNNAGGGGGGRGHHSPYSYSSASRFQQTMSSLSPVKKDTSPERPPSTTSAASYNRITRLQREAAATTTSAAAADVNSRIRNHSISPAAIRNNNANIATAVSPAGGRRNASLSPLPQKQQQQQRQQHQQQQRQQQQQQKLRQPQHYQQIPQTRQTTAHPPPESARPIIRQRQQQQEHKPAPPESARREQQRPKPQISESIRGNHSYEGNNSSVVSSATGSNVRRLKTEMQTRRLIGLGERTTTTTDDHIHPQRSSDVDQRRGGVGGRGDGEGGGRGGNANHGGRSQADPGRGGGGGGHRSERKNSNELRSRIVGRNHRDDSNQQHIHNHQQTQQQHDLSPTTDGSSVSHEPTTTRGPPSSSLFSHVKGRRGHPKHGIPTPSSRQPRTTTGTGTVQGARSQNQYQQQSSSSHEANPEDSPPVDSEKLSPTASSWNRRMRRQAQISSRIRAQLMQPDLSTDENNNSSSNNTASAGPMPPLAATSTKDQDNDDDDHNPSIDESSSASPQRSSRRDKIHRMQKIKGLEHIRRHATTASPQNGPAAAVLPSSLSAPGSSTSSTNNNDIESKGLASLTCADDSSHHDSLLSTPSSRPVNPAAAMMLGRRRKGLVMGKGGLAGSGGTGTNVIVNPAPSAENANDDEITLTSVRQIVEKTAGGDPTTSLPESAPVHANSSVSNNNYNNGNSIHNSSADGNESGHNFKEESSKGAGEERLWMNGGEEKSDKVENAASSSGIGLSRSSSSYETDGDHSRGPQSALYGDEILQDPTMSASQMTPDVGLFYEQQKQHYRQTTRLPTAAETTRTRDIPVRPRGNKIGTTGGLATAATAAVATTTASARGCGDDDDNNTYDFGVRDDTVDAGGVGDSNEPDADSQASLSYEQRRQRDARERAAREAAVAAAKSNMDGPFVHEGDVEHYRRSLDTPLVKTAAGVIGAAAVGCVVLGPVGLLLGTAAVGIGVGIMQIPEEQRNNMYDKAKEAVHKAQDSVSDSCANTYRDSGVSEHIPVDLLMCCASIDDVAQSNDKENNRDAIAAVGSKENMQNKDLSTPHSGEMKKSSISPTRTNRSQLHNDNDYTDGMMEGRIVPVNQIHALDPSAQPRAWLDVLASNETSHDEKIEAMEEILIMAKDKQRARIFVEEGILDSIMWTISSYLEKVSASRQQQQQQHDVAASANEGLSIHSAAQQRQLRLVTPEETRAAKLAALCCLTLGKAYCAAIHTEGDLLLMSLYERGTVPEERQLAQMLHEVPYHARTTVNLSLVGGMGSASGINPASLDDSTMMGGGEEILTLQQLSLPQAEELAIAIKDLADQ